MTGASSKSHPDGPRAVYSHGHHDSVLRSHRWRTAENSAGYLLPSLAPDHRLLDVGAGPGTITVDFATRLTEGTVVGIDNASAAVEAARRLATERNVSNITLEQGDVYALEFTDGCFDVVHAHQVLQHLDDPVAALREMGRVCTQEGVVAARDADYAVMTWFPESSALTRWLDLYHSVARANGGEPDAGRRLKAWALAAGFTDVRASASAWCFAEPEDLAWWSDTWAERLVKSDFGQHAAAHGFSDTDELQDLADGWRVWAARDDAWFTVLHGEVLCTNHPAK